MDAISSDEAGPNVPIREKKTTQLTLSTSRGTASHYGNGLKSPATEIATLANAIVVPKAQRRGLLGWLTLIAELENPKGCSRRIKWLITLTVSAGAAVITTVRSYIGLVVN